MTHDDELRTLRARVASIEDELARRSADAMSGTPAQVVEHRRAGGFVNTAGRFFLGRPLRIEGVESEGATAAVAGQGGPDWAVRVLGAVPQIGDLLVARNAAHRWHAWRGGPGGDDCVDCVNSPGCPCQQTPRFLRMVSSHPASNGGILRSATIEYQDVPVALQPLVLNDRGYLSTTQFRDTLTDYMFWYYLSCFQNYYLLTRLFANYIYGTPYRDIVRYSWQIGITGNTCSPFALTNGTIFVGGDPICVVTIAAMS